MRQRPRSEKPAASAVPPPRLEGTVELSDRRRLGIAEYGPPTGRPVLWFHGTPGARRQIPPRGRAAAEERGVRIVAIERPGIGGSTAHLYERVADWVDDVEEVAECLGLGRFGVVGLSGGGPYALACASQLPDRVVAAAILGGVAPAVGEDAAPGGLVSLAPYAEPLVALWRRPLGRGLHRLLRGILPWSEQFMNQFFKLMPPGDQELYSEPAMREMFLDDFVRGSRDQMQSVVSDIILFGRPWGFSLGEIRTPVRFWHGDSDNIVPLSHGEHMAARVSDSQLRVRPGEGHLGTLAAAEEVLDAILGCWSERGAASAV